MPVLAASAAGVGLLALAGPAQAEVVYTPVNQVIGYNGVYGLDLNHDGTVDFLIQQWNYGNWASNNQLLADPAVGNGVEGNSPGGGRAAFRPAHWAEPETLLRAIRTAR